MQGPKRRVPSMAGPYQRLAEGKRFTAAKKGEAEARPRPASMTWLPWILVAVLVALRWIAAPAPIPALEPWPEAPAASTEP